jgi:hypothetical protein
LSGCLFFCCLFVTSNTPPAPTAVVNNATRHKCSGRSNTQTTWYGSCACIQRPPGARHFTRACLAANRGKGFLVWE